MPMHIQIYKLYFLRRIITNCIGESELRGPGLHLLLYPAAGGRSGQAA